MKRIFIFSCCVLLLILTYSLMVRSRVAEHAAEIAADQPYCIVVPRGYRYVPAIEFIDTMGLVMHGSRERNHAILVVGYKENQKTYHWSYFNNGFVEGAYGPFGFTCAKNKFDYENLKSSDYAETVSISANGVEYLVPLVYQPSKLGSGLDASIVFMAQLPEFKPVRDTRSVRVIPLIHAQKHNGKPLRAVEELPNSMDNYQSLREYNLKTGQYVIASGTWLPKNTDTDYSGPGYGIYYAEDINGNVAAVISCLFSPEVQCLHEFKRGEITYSFHHMPSDLVRWRELEENVVKFVDSFVVSKP